MEEQIRNLKPQSLWEKFVEISRIPRNSKEEARSREYVLAQAGKANLETKVDSVGNVLVKKKGRGDRKNRPVTIVQAHLDMVCVADKGTIHDFENDPLQLVTDGIIVKAKGTSLGADNGIGVAAMLALMEDPTLNAGPLEFLFTVDEETGLTGALDLDKNLLHGKRLLNTDTKDEGTIYIGCVGGLDICSSLTHELVPVTEGECPLVIKIGGLIGGHSGIDINKRRINALKALAGLLREVVKVTQFSLAHIEGGNKSNVIPREAEAVVTVAKENVETVNKAVANYLTSKKKEYGDHEPGLKIEIQKVSSETELKSVIADSFTEKLVSFLWETPNGVLSMSETLPDLVETSVNLATVKMEESGIKVGMNCRSSTDLAMDAVAESVKNIAMKFGMETECGDRYPGWLPDLQSPLLQSAKKVYREKFGKEPEVKGIHAGLECGVIGGKYPGMEMISFGPSIQDLHSPQERVNIASVEKHWIFLRALLEAL